MGKHFQLARTMQSYKPRRQSSPAEAILAETNIQTIGYIAFGVLIVLAFLYLIQVNTFSTKGYEIHNLQKQITRLQEQNKKIAIESSLLQSLSRIEADPQSSIMVPVTQIGYIRTTSLSRR